LNRHWREYAILLGVAGIVIALDQWTKWLVRTNLPFQSTWLPSWLEWLAPFARIVNWSNSGAAFGTFQNGNTVFTVIAVVVIAAILYYYPKVDANDWTLRLAMGLQLGGAAGNLIDRLILHRVTDFIAVGSFPVFNIADASISIGVAVLLLGVWIKERSEKKRRMPKEEPAGTPEKAE
jgi:signal peptidase II